jgi:hypothetical protein
MDVVGIGVVITPVACGVPSRAADVPGLSGTSIARPAPGTLLERLCGTGDLRGEYFCNFEANPDFVSRWQEAGPITRPSPDAWTSGGDARCGARCSGCSSNTFDR